jgi:iron complex outermembrane recepter protein
MTSLRALLLASAAAFVVSAALPAAFAQTTETDEKTDVVVITGSQVDLSREYVGGQVARGGRAGIFGALDVMDSPFSSTNYTEELARNQQARSVADVLQNDPVVRVAKGFGNAQELYMIRGFPVYSDDMTYNGVYGILPRQFVASELLERVEVLHGANAFLNGAAPGGSGVGGAFNLVPKRAPNRDLNTLTAGWTTGGELYAAADIARRFGADKEFGARLNLAKRSGEGSVNDQDRDLSVIAAGLDYDGNQFRFSADVGYQDQHIDAPAPQVTPSGAIPAPPSADSSLAQPWTFSDEKQLFGVVRGEYDFNDAVTAWAAVGARDGEENNIFFNLNTDAAGSLSSFRFDNARKDEVVSADAGVRADFDTGPVGHRVIVSGSAVTLKSRNAYAYGAFGSIPGSLYNPVDIALPPTTGGAGSMTNPLETERSESSSFAVADLLSFMDGQLLVSIGGRYQELDTRSFNYDTGATLSSYKSDAVTPAVGVVYKATDQFSLYANYSEALAPSGTAPATDGGGNPVSNAGEVLAPFRGKQYEAGVKYDGGNFGGTLAAFTLTLPSAFIQNGTFDANGEQENSGIELSAFGEALPGVRVLGGLTLLNAELTRTSGGALDGNQPIGVPELQANINLEWDVPMVPGLTVDGRIVRTGEQQANAANTVQLDSWTRFDLGVRYPFEIAQATVTLRARLENVTDEDYWASTGGYPGYNYLVLGAPRTAVVSASVDF